MRNPDRETSFRFKRFAMSNHRSAMKIGTDGVALGAWAFSFAPADRCCCVLDVGTGTGLLALMLAQRFSAAEITGVEIEPMAAGEAADNFASSPWASRLTALHADFRKFAESCQPATFDMLISNPPYFTNGAKAPDPARTLARHADTLDAVAVVRLGAPLLRPGGLMAMVVPAELLEQLRLEATLAGLCQLRLTALRTAERKPPRRILLEWRKPAGLHPSPTLPQTADIMTVGDENFNQLLKPFLLDK